MILDPRVVAGEEPVDAADDQGLHLWRIPDGEVARVRSSLAGSPALIC